MSDEHENIGPLSFLRPLPLEEAERAVILWTIDQHKTKKQAAKALGIAIRTLRNKLKKYKREDGT